MSNLTRREADGRRPQRMASRSIGLVIILSFLMAVLVKVPPAHNWDLLGYVGVVYSFTEDDPEVIHDKTYAEAKANVPPARYRNLIGESLPEESRDKKYRASVATDPKSFVQQLPFYGVKPAYPALMFLLSKTGMDLVTASVVISKTATVLIVVLLYYWLSINLRPVVATILTMLMIRLVAATAGTSSPDALSNLFLLGAFFLLIEYRTVRVALLVTILSIAVRPDNVILCFLLAIYVALFDSQHRIWAIGAAVAGTGLYVTEATLAGSYGWPTFFYHSFVEFLSEPATFSSALSLREYMEIYVRSALSAYLFVWWLLFYGLALLVRYENSELRDISLGILVVNLFYMFAHWLVYPNPRVSFFVASYLVMLVVLILTVFHRRIKV